MMARLGGSEWVEPMLPGRGGSRGAGRHGERPEAPAGADDEDEDGLAETTALPRRRSLHNIRACNPNPTGICKRSCGDTAIPTVKNCNNRTTEEVQLQYTFSYMI